MIMDAEKYLLQIRKLNHMIQNKVTELEQLRSMTGSKAITYDSEHVQTSRNLEGFAKYIPSIVTLDNEINQAVDEFVSKKNEIIKVIEQVQSPDIYDVLYMYYVQEMKWTEISIEKNFTYQWIHELKRKGIEEVQSIIDRSL